MKFPLRSVVLTLIGALSLITLAIPPCVAGRNVSQETQQPDASGDGQHDFDFNLGIWKTHVSRLLHPLSGSSTRAEYDGTSVVNKVWGGRANLLELEVDGPAGHIEGAGLRLYNARSHQWSLNWASSADGDMEHPVIGRFGGGAANFSITRSLMAGACWYETRFPTSRRTSRASNRRFPPMADAPGRQTGS